MAKLEVLVVNATGQQGSAVAHALLRVGHRVRAHVPSLAHPEAELLRQRGATLAWAALGDGRRMQEAMRGAHAVFAATSPALGPLDEAQQGLLLVEHARQAGVPHLVYSALMGAGPSGARHGGAYEVERYIQAVGQPHTILRSGFFMDNLLADAWRAELQAGRLPLPLSPGCKLQQIAVADLARFVRVVMECADRFVGQRVCIASDELTPLEMAATLARAIGQRVEHVHGENPSGRSVLEPLFDAVETGAGCADVPGLRRDYPEVNWHTLDGWARRQAWG